MKYRGLDLSKIKEDDRFQVNCAYENKYPELCKQHGRKLGNVRGMRAWRLGCPNCKVEVIE